MAEQIAPQVAGDPDEGVIGDPGSDPPQQIIGGNQRAQNGKRGAGRRVLAAGERVDQKLDAVLRADGTPYGCEYRGQNNGMGDRPQTDVAKDEREG